MGPEAEHYSGGLTCEFSLETPQLWFIVKALCHTLRNLQNRSCFLELFLTDPILEIHS